MNYELLLELLTKKLIGDQDLSEAERDILSAGLRDPEIEELLGPDPDFHQLQSLVRRLEGMNVGRMDRKLAALKAAKAPITMMIFKRYLVAASILLIGGFIGLRIYFKRPSINQTVFGETVQPAVNMARLRLSDGSTVVLDSSKDGQIARDAGIAVEKSGSQIQYNQIGVKNGNLSAKNTLSVPRGALFEVTLNDQTHVWLNSESELIYPVQFGNERRVKLVGEAYFEVAKDSRRPFVLETPHGTVKVLGTSFNVNAYADNNSEMTTLVDGSVQVSDGNTALLLLPGSQAIEKAGGMSLTHPSIQNVTAWRRGFFALQDADIQTIMQQICRFYNVEVEYMDKSSLSKQTYYGTIPRNQTLQETLKALEQLKIQATLKNRTIIVEPERP
jgi:ferric-dicitrate binding protein FerR (iron transport regulator)